MKSVKEIYWGFTLINPASRRFKDLFNVETVSEGFGTGLRKLCYECLHCSPLVVSALVNVIQSFPSLVTEPNQCARCLICISFVQHAADEE